MTDQRLTELDTLKGTVSESEFLARVAVEAAAVLEYFLRVHPFANGNGHAGRLLVWAITGRYGYWPHRFTVEPRPADPRYITGLRIGTQTGDVSVLARCVLDALTPN